MTDARMELVDWLDDLCVRFIVNLPYEELQSVERICFQIEEAQWFYEDFIRPLDPSLPSMNLRTFAMRMFQHCPLSAGFSALHHAEAYQQFLEYKTRVPVRGAIMLNDDMTHAVLVKGWKKGAKWSFPRGKINKDEADLDCAVREVYEETGYDLRAANLVGPEDKMKSIAVNMREQSMLLYVFRGVPMDTHFEPRTRKEISVGATTSCGPSVQLMRAENRLVQTRRPTYAQAKTPSPARHRPGPHQGKQLLHGRALPRPSQGVDQAAEEARQAEGSLRRAPLAASSRGSDRHGGARG